MAYEVLITDQAFADLDSITGFIKSQASLGVARKWLAAILGTIDTLREMPGRCPPAPDAEELGDAVRLLLHGNKNRAYKIYLKIMRATESSGSVQVLHVRHWARKPLTNEELEELMADEQERDSTDDGEQLVAWLERQTAMCPKELDSAPPIRDKKRCLGPASNKDEDYQVSSP